MFLLIFFHLCSCNLLYQVTGFLPKTDILQSQMFCSKTPAKDIKKLVVHTTFHNATTWKSKSEAFINLFSFALFLYNLLYYFLSVSVCTMSIRRKECNAVFDTYFFLLFCCRIFLYANLSVKALPNFFHDIILVFYIAILKFLFLDSMLFFSNSLLSSEKKKTKTGLHISGVRVSHTTVSCGLAEHLFWDAFILY